MVLAMTMVMGIGVTALAAEPDPLPEGCPQSVNTCTCENTLSRVDRIVYVYGFDTHPSSGQRVAKTAYYDKTTGEYQGKIQGYIIENYLHDEAEIGRIYHANQAGKFVLCACNLPRKENKDETTDSSHTHNFQWQTITAPTKDTDGLEGEVCSCGAVKNTQPLSAYGYALNDYATPAEKIKPSLATSAILLLICETCILSSLKYPYI